MKTPEELISEYAETYSEYGEMLGVYFPGFLLHKIAYDLTQAQSKIDYYQRREQEWYSRK